VDEHALTQPATTPVSKRGRPKGTGIDDRPILVQISGLLKTNRKLNPTAAIRSIGITDASVVRRLRNKLKQPTSVTRTEKKAPTIPKKQLRSQKAPASIKKTIRPKAAPLLKKQLPPIKSVISPKKPLPKKAKLGLVQPPKIEPLQPKPEPATNQPNFDKPASAQPETNRSNVDALRLTLETAVAMSRIQRQLFDQAIANTPLGLIYKSQAMFAEFIATAMLSHQALFRKNPTDQTK
jgi:hypothetical protein